MVINVYVSRAGLGWLENSMCDGKPSPANELLRVFLVTVSSAVTSLSSDSLPAIVRSPPIKG